MVNLYADLVEKGLRALDENEEGIILVPLFLREQVRVEVNRRKAETPAIQRGDFFIKIFVNIKTNFLYYQLKG